MAKAKRAKAAPAIAESIFDHFEAHGRTMSGEPAQEQQTQAKGQEQDVSALMARLAALESSNEELRRAALAAGPQPQDTGPIVDPAKATLDLKGLPDPVDKPAEYNAELATRINAVVDQRVHAVQQGVASANEQAAAADRLWNGFVEKHPEWAEYPEIVGAVAKSVVDDATRRGIDPKKYLFSATDTYLEDVAKALNSKYGALVKDPDEDTGPETERAPSTEVEPGAGRTGGIWGGPESGNRPSAGPDPQSGPGNMFKDLTDVQKRMGLI